MRHADPGRLRFGLCGLSEFTDPLASFDQNALMLMMFRDDITMAPPATHETGHFYFAQTGHAHFAATLIKTGLRRVRVEV
jgi:hypothetical protein